jgi:2-C-methyl-D-erythritol 4-phosphate cytidylyltransferase
MRKSKKKSVALLLCGGKGRRMGSDENKLLLPLGQKPVFIWSLKTLEESRYVHGIYIVVPREQRERFEEEISKWGRFEKLRKIVEGGRRRQDSFRNGLMAIEGKWDYLLVHDGARPFLREELIEKGVSTLEHSVSSIPVVPVVDTIKLVDAEGFVKRTLPRNSVVRAQTPQFFRFDEVKDSIMAVDFNRINVTDDASLIYDPYNQRD